MSRGLALIVGMASGIGANYLFGSSPASHFLIGLAVSAVVTFLMLQVDRQ